MNVGINWPALAILVAIFVVMQIRSLPLRIRYFLSAGLYAVIGILALPRGGAGHSLNLLVAGIAFLFAVVYAFRGMKSRGH